MKRRRTHRLFLFYALALAAALRFGSASSAALITNPARPITHQVTVQLIQTALDNGTSPATVFGDATRRAAIEATIDSVWAQAGIDVQFLANVVRYNDTFAYQGLLAPTLIRPTQDLSLMLVDGQSQGGILNPDASVINIFFVNIVPGFNLKGTNWANGVGNIGANGIAMFIGSAVSVDHAAHWVSHEIGHNLGLEHTDPVDNLMLGSSRKTSVLTNEQIAAVFQTQARADAVATIPAGGTGFPKLLPIQMVGDYDRNGIVDATDYILWRNTRNSTSSLAADGNGNGMIDEGDYMIWRSNFGKVAGASSAITTAGSTGQFGYDGGAPEPSSFALLSGAVALLCVARGRRQRERISARQ